MFLKEIYRYATESRKAISTNQASLLEGLICGDGGTRTLVQTPHRVAFYTLIRPLFFDHGLPDGGPAEAYRLNLGDTQPSRCRADRLK